MDLAMTQLPPTVTHDDRDERTLTVLAMGGSLSMRVACAVEGAERAEHDLDRATRRVDRWAARLTRYTSTSDLAALNADPARVSSEVSPTLAAALDWAERACFLEPGLVDVTLLDERLGAESGPDDITDPGMDMTDPGMDMTDSGMDMDTQAGMADPVARPRWHLVRHARGGRVVRRGSFRFDLDGVAKGWIADRALALLGGYPAALVDADGDIALRIDEGVSWDVAVADPRAGATDPLAVLRLDHQLAGGALGIATSGTSVHRWASGAGGPPRHHLLDPRTGRPASTDVVQATVISGSAREAEVLAKSAVIAGSDAALQLLDRPGVSGAILLLDTGETIALPITLGWLA